MGIISKIYNSILAIIGFIILLCAAYIFVVNYREEQEHKQILEKREEIAEETLKASRQRGGIGDLDKLRLEYLKYCENFPFTVHEGSRSEICAAVADTLLEQSLKRQLTVADQIEINYNICVHEAKEFDYDPEDRCHRIDFLHNIMRDALAKALCTTERSWVTDEDWRSQITKRGSAVYVDTDLRVDCQTGIFEEWDYEGFFEGRDDDGEWSSKHEALGEAIEDEDYERAIALLENYEFGVDEGADYELISMSLYLPDDHFLNEILKRDNSKVNFEVDYYNQPLAQAIDQDNSEAALRLLKAGADPLRPYQYGQTPIALAAGRGMLDVVKALVAHGADVDGVLGSESLNFGEPLLWSAHGGHRDTVLWLLDNGAKAVPEDPSKYPNWEPGSLLDYAVAGVDADIVKRLIALGAKSDNTLRLFENAASGARPDVIDLLLAEGYQLPDAKDHDRIYDKVYDKVDEVVRKQEDPESIQNAIATLQVLLEHGLDMSKNNSGWTHAHQAVTFIAPTIIDFKRDEQAGLVHTQRLQFVKLVIEEVLATGIDVDHTYEGNTLLMKAADGGKAELVKYLLEIGADPDLKNDEGQTALDIALSEGRRMSRIRKNKPEVAERFGNTIEMLGGNRESLNQAQ